ncbi:uncharacterized protein 2b [SARS coronavirus ZJ0301]|uniref:Uncharacterized protein 2b n=1 Tax=SARS coronavirus ZJ0301 TaxID=344702 RepID=Q3S2D1_SARS|nr:uncharacterized protein 2b [SARS coronavirus ZJ0301]
MHLIALSSTYLMPFRLMFQKSQVILNTYESLCLKIKMGFSMFIRAINL